MLPYGDKFINAAVSKEIMGKRKNRKPEGIGLSRRALLLAGAGMAVLGAYAIFGNRKEQQSLTEFMQSNIFGKSGKSFTHPFYENAPAGIFADSASQEIADRVKPVLMQKYGDLSNVGMKVSKEFAELDVPDGVFNQFTKRLEPIIEAYFRDLEIPTPRINWQRFTPATNVQYDAGITVLITERTTTHYFFGKQGGELEKYITADNVFVNGEAKGSTELKVNGDKVLLSHSRGPLLVNLTAGRNASAEALETVNTVLSELLHYHTSPHSVKYAEKRINELFKKNNSVLTGQILQPIVNQSLAQEEGVVHAATFKWIREKWLPSQKDISMKDFETDFANFVQKPMCSRLKRIYDLPKSPKELVKAYMLNPEMEQ